MAKTSTLRPIDEWEMALNRSQTQSGSMSKENYRVRMARATFPLAGYRAEEFPE